MSSLFIVGSCRFFIANTRNIYIENQIKTIKHKRAISAATTSTSVTSYYKKNEFEDVERKRLSADGLWATTPGVNLQIN